MEIGNDGFPVASRALISIDVARTCFSEPTMAAFKAENQHNHLLILNQEINFDSNVLLAIATIPSVFATEVCRQPDNVDLFSFSSLSAFGLLCDELNDFDLICRVHFKDQIENS